MDSVDLQQQVLAHVQSPDYRPTKPRGIAKRLDLPPDQWLAVRRAVKQLVRQGELVYGQRHVVYPGGAAPSRGAERGMSIGTFRRTGGGMGVVRLKEDGPDREIFIPARRALDASSRDTVEVRLTGTRRRGPQMRQAGEVVRVLERATYQFVGTYYELAGRGLVQVDGSVFDQPIAVEDPGAKGARTGDKVVLEMVHFPTSHGDGEGVITEVLGERGQPGLETQVIMRQFDLPERFPEDVLEAAREQVARFEDQRLPADRRDLTDWTVITIDPKDARDFDDAISLVRRENGHWRLGVHIADVAHFVPLHSPLDREAQQRATSVYLPDRVIPMLPEVISNNLASLQPERMRLAKTVLIEFTAEGIPVDTEFCSAAIRSNRRFTYEEVDDYLRNPVPWKQRLSSEVEQLLSRMHRLAMILRGRRVERGALELKLPEIKLELDAHHRVKRCRRVEHTESHQIIEEFMLAANEAVAQKLKDLGIHFLRRIHQSPDPRKLQQLTGFVRDLGIETESLESRFEIQRVLGLVDGRPEEQAVNYAVLRSLAKAAYAPYDEGHYALASNCYCHFTSPIRRYPDLTVHRILDGLFHGRPAGHSFEHLLTLGEHCSDREQRAEMAERELVKLKLLEYLKDRIGLRMDAVVTGVEDYGLFVQGLKIPAEGLIHISTMAQDRYFYDSRAHTLSGHREGNRFRLGDLVRVEVARVDLDRRQLDFQLVAQGKAKRARSAAPSNGRRSAPAKRGRRAKRKDR